MSTFSSAMVVLHWDRWGSDVGWFRQHSTWIPETTNKPARFYASSPLVALVKAVLYWVFWVSCMMVRTRRIDFVEPPCIILSAFSSILDDQSHFARSCVWLDWWLLCVMFYFSTDAAESLFNYYKVIERGRVLHGFSPVCALLFPCKLSWKFCHELHAR